ncbi:MAG: aminoglycoside phosphotransferase family protein [Candidatus Devosia phytovorans]|uniref:Aminoglycoside phosphotransferase family protein n=1 Tax=Candidatus Devosia phytovorans TaxID=3121372 RepID=A0AAJ5VT96_9HYPH|nr:aminoglycoside phosphotransferase family protein [Devosia sp.]WEK03197.1 MAG: aminoglycoside phosphotransferase family protein [Devosia sp.]
MNQSPVETALSRAMIRWSLTKSTPVAETATSWIFRVEQNGRNFAALKILKPQSAPEERRGSLLLNWYDGEGAATVFDMHGDTIFMEWLDGGTLGDPARAGKDDETTIAAATLVANLHRPRAEPPQGLEPLRDRFQTLFDTDVRAWPHTARDLYARSAGIALKLFDRPSAQIPLHGDLHHDNILSSDRGWLAIDPKGLLGDPAYEVANIFINPLNGLQIAADPRRIAARADTFAERLAYPRKRILGWAAAHAALSACWDLAAERPITTQLACLPHLLSAYDQA